MLYHLNLGAPVVVPGTTVAIDRRATVLREPCDAVPAWELLPDPSDGMTEAVFEHHDPVVLDGMARAVVTGPRHRVEISWTADTLPRLFQWVLPTRRRWALGIEPATAPMFGSDRLPDAGGAPLLAPDEARVQRVRVEIRDAARD